VARRSIRAPAARVGCLPRVRCKSSQRANLVVIATRSGRRFSALALRLGANTGRRAPSLAECRVSRELCSSPLVPC
jgi:hypothetical protein